MDLQKPKPEVIQRVFEWMAEVIMNTTRDVVAPAMRAAAEDLCGPDAEKLYSSDTRDLLAFFVTLRRLLREVRIAHRTWGVRGSCADCMHSAASTTSRSRTFTSQPTCVSSRSSPT
jgi:hypothetical protein